MRVRSSGQLKSSSMNPVGHVRTSVVRFNQTMYFTTGVDCNFYLTSHIIPPFDRTDRQGSRSEFGMLRSLFPVLAVFCSIYVFRYVSRKEEFIPLTKKVQAVYDYVIGECYIYTNGSRCTGECQKRPCTSWHYCTMNVLCGKLQL